MNTQPYDIVIIGGGIAGYTASLKAASLGASVGLVEANLIGGTCLNMGCIPTKALLESCRVLRTASRAADFGVKLEHAVLEPAVMVSRSRSMVNTMRGAVEELLARNNVDVIRGAAKLRSPTRVDVVTGGKTRQLEARTIIVATGSSWITLPGLEIDGTRIITSDHALDLEHTTGSMVIIGGGAVGCEFAEIYSALGTRITIVEMMGHILPGEDTELARRLEASLRRKGIQILTSSAVVGVSESNQGLEIAIDGGPVLHADRVLVSVGRRPNTEGIGLENVGVAVERQAIRTDGSMRTTVANIFAAGDVTGEYPLAHVALAQGIIAAENACGSNSQVDYVAVPRCVYTDPEFAAVGLTESDATAGGVKALVNKVRLGQIGRALTLGETFGLAKIVYEYGTGRVLGFHALAPHASELLAEMALAIQNGMTVKEIAQVIHPHPTLSEITWECARGAPVRPTHGG